MKTGYIWLFTLLGIAFTIAAIFVGCRVINDLSTPEYEYLENYYRYGDSLIIEDIAYVEIPEEEYEIIKDILKKQNNEQLVDEFIVGIDYPYADDLLEYSIYGDKGQEDRILLRGEHASFFDSNRPDLYFCRIDKLYSNLELTEYQYSNDGYTIVGDGVIYKEIDETTFEKIKDEFEKQNIYGFPFLIIGKISYNYKDEWKLILHGNTKQEERIFLIGKERYAYYDEDYIEVYYCREDVLNLFNGNNGSLANVDLHEYMK